MAQSQFLQTLGQLFFGTQRRVSALNMLHTAIWASLAAPIGIASFGQHLGFSPQYLYQYANHAAWLEDNRRSDNGTLVTSVVSNDMGSPVRRQWKGYWQRAA